MAVSVYRGYSTIGNTFKGVRVNDQELIKRDLLNHFAIRKGEKLMNYRFIQLNIASISSRQQNKIFLTTSNFGLIL